MSLIIHPIYQTTSTQKKTRNSYLKNVFIEIFCFIMNILFILQFPGFNQQTHRHTHTNIWDRENQYGHLYTNNKLSHIFYSFPNNKKKTFNFFCCILLTVHILFIHFHIIIKYFVLQ